CAKSPIYDGYYFDYW
nr:immunoglobulin heavy chain junction region [Mus musculus]